MVVNVYTSPDIIKIIISRMMPCTAYRPIARIGEIRNAYGI
jgi:hypothetical protein